MVGICFIMGEWEIFKASLHSWPRGTNPYFLKFPLYCLLLPLPYFCLPPPTPPATSLSPPAPFPTALSVVLSFLGE